MSATTSVRIMSGLMMRAQIGVQKSTGKIRGNWRAKKGCFWRVGGDVEKWDNGVEQGDGDGVKKFLRDRHGVAEWDGLIFQTNKIF